ncbi:MAG: hypothetical protein Fur0041_18670 [Bacteroidia bacterium]
MKKILLSASLLLGISAFAQKPYFQQFVKYNIQVKLNDQKHELTAFETIEYTNNSSDQLTFIYMHLWPNAYKNNHTAMGKQVTENGELFFYYAKEEDRGYIDSLDFKVDGQPVKMEPDPKNPDICKIILNQPLNPGEKITISTPFHVKIPSGKISRLGHIDQQYQITQWYPKPAVYDRNGWNPIPYLDQGEFYSEFGTYDVSITLPKNYVLGATGDIQNNPEEIEFLNNKVKETEAIKSFDKKELAYPASSNEWKTVTFHQENVHDFAWFCDKRYHVLKGEVELPHSKRKVTTWVMFTNQYADLWVNSIPYMNDAIYYYSLWNGDYQYNHATAVDGALSAGGGMEYPNITVIGGVGNAFTLETVIMHEVGHNWFYGMLGSNERVHPWMDEGINSANELRYIETKYPKRRLIENEMAAKAFDLSRYKQKAQYYQLYAFSARQDLDQPCEMHSADYTSINYGAIVYSKTATCFDYLRGYLGDSLYDKCFRTYFDRWHFKHPMPEDIRATFEEVSGKNLSWFFDDMIGTTKALDYKITSAKKNTTGWTIGVKNNGSINGPVLINAIKNNVVVKSVWYEGFSGKKALEFPSCDADEFMIDQPEDMPEIRRGNNTISTSGIFRKTEPLKIQFLGSLDNPGKTQLFWTPAMGFNYYDKFMIGAAFYNKLVPQKKFEWTLMPMYSTGSGKAVGYTDAFFNITPGKVFQKIRIGAKANQYNFYKVKNADHPLDKAPDRELIFRKIAPEISFDIRKKKLRSPINQTIKVRGIWLKEDIIKTDYAPDFSSYNWYIGTTERTFYEGSYTLTNTRKVHPYSFKVAYQQGDNMSKVTFTGNYRISYSAKKGIDFRIFAGAFIDTTNTGPYRFRMSGWGPLGIGNHDYLYDNIMLGRSENSGLLAQQFVEEDGGFKVYSPVGQSGKWMLAVNMNADLPFKKGLLNMIHLYADAGICGEDGRVSESLLYNAGIKLSVLGGGLLDIYFPLIISKDIKNYYNANGLKYGNQIRFTFNIGKFNLSNLSGLISLGS